MSGTRDELAAAVASVRERYETIIGLEVHLQLKTASKVFCACSTRFGDPPNTNTCAVCLGLPGALPVLNRRAVEMAVLAALALSCRVDPHSRFARKNYFYPDLAKGYQISQYDQPLAEHGHLEIESNGESKRIGITRLHLEEDAAKTIHDGYPDSDEKSYVNFNRAGVALVEIVSEPDLRSPAEAYDYLTRLKQIMEYIRVSDCNMEEGSLRCDANVSVRRKGAEKFGTKTEVKNLNSFRYLTRALDYEIDRQIAAVESGNTIEQETRLWNLAAQRTEPMRSKEYAHDYRYFPEPDLVPLVVSDAWREQIRATLPELPEAKRARFAQNYGITPYDGGVLTATRELADYFEAVGRQAPNAKTAANWVQSELLGLLKAAGKEISESPVSAQALAELLTLLDKGTVSGKMAKGVFEKMFATGQSAAETVAAEGLAQISDAAAIEKVIRDVLATNPKQLEQYKKGKTATFGFFVGQVMKATRGQANPQLVNELLKKILEE